MSYSSYSRLPSATTYSDLLRRLEKTEPIRGRAPVLRPYGERRYADMFSIRMVGDESSKPRSNRYKPTSTAQDGDIELMYYDRPVVTVHKPKEGDNTEANTKTLITIDPCGSYWSAGDCKFISAVLRRHVLYSGTSKDRLVITKSNREKVVLAPGQVAQFVLGWEAMEPVEEIKHATLRLNRKAANNVRAKYGAFYRYMKGMIAVRKEDMSALYGKEMVAVVRFSIEELDGSGFLKVDRSLPQLTQKPARSTEGYAKWKERVEQFIKLISTPETDPQQTENFARAFAGVACASSRSHSWGKSFGTQITASHISRCADEIIFKYHSQEVFEEVEVPKGSVPTGTYNSWVDRE